MNLGELAVLLLPVMVAVYTLNYSRWAWRHQLRRGAVGLTVLAVSTVALPAFVLWIHS